MSNSNQYFVKQDTKVGIPAAHDFYLSASIGCALADIGIDENGRFFLIRQGEVDPLQEPTDDINKIKEGQFDSVDFVMYCENPGKVWHQFELVVLNNQILRVKKQGKLVYLAEGYPLLDEATNPLAKGHFLSIVKTLNGEHAGQKSFHHCRLHYGKHRPNKTIPFTHSLNWTV